MRNLVARSLGTGRRPRLSTSALVRLFLMTIGATLISTSAFAQSVGGGRMAIARPERAQVVRVAPERAQVFRAQKEAFSALRGTALSRAVVDTRAQRFFVDALPGNRPVHIATKVDGRDGNGGRAGADGRNGGVSGGRAGGGAASGAVASFAEKRSVPSAVSCKPGAPGCASVSTPSRARAFEASLLGRDAQKRGRPQD